MYSRTAKARHYLPRTGSYSTVPHRNGRVDVLPPQARDALYSIASQIDAGQSRLQELRAEKAAIQLDLDELRHLDAMRLKVATTERNRAPNPRIASLEARIRELDSEAKRIRAHVAQLNRLASGGQKMSVEVAFYNVARAELPQDTWEKLNATAEAIARRFR